MPSILKRLQSSLRILKRGCTTLEMLHIFLLKLLNFSLTWQGGPPEIDDKKTIGGLNINAKWVALRRVYITPVRRRLQEQEGICMGRRRLQIREKQCARSVKRVHRHHFGDDRIISRQFPTAWLPRFPDLYPWGYWLWGHLKDMVYRHPSTSLSDIKESVERQCVTLINSC